jgi:hypothetical protein
MSDKTMLEQEATADEICAYSLTVQVVPPFPAKDELDVGTTTWIVVTTAAEDGVACGALILPAALELRVIGAGAEIAGVA